MQTLYVVGGNQLGLNSAQSLTPSSSLRPGLVYTDNLFSISVHGEMRRNQLRVYKHVVYCSVQLGSTVQTSDKQRPSQSTIEGTRVEQTRELIKYTEHKT